MRELFQLMRTELVKMKHTFLIPLHIISPILGCVIFLLYYRISGWNETAQISGFLEVVGIALPFLVSVVCAGSVGLEERNHFQTFLGGTARKWNAFLAKFLVLLALCLMTMLAAVLFFGAGFRWGLGKEGLSFGDYGMLALVLVLGSVPLYMEHLFLNLIFTKAVSLGVGVTQFLVAALFLTGLGDGRWQLFPCSWSSRGVLTALLCLTNGELSAAWMAMLRNSAIICLLLTGLVYAIIRIWFHFYEGRQCDD